MKKLKRKYLNMGRKTYVRHCVKKALKVLDDSANPAEALNELIQRLMRHPKTCGHHVVTSRDVLVLTSSWTCVNDAKEYISNIR